jgi:hypothetical protein
LKGAGYQLAPIYRFRTSQIPDRSSVPVSVPGRFGFPTEPSWPRGGSCRKEIVLVSRVSISPSLASLQTRFVSILPRIEAHGHFHFRWKFDSAREDLLAEMVAMCWKCFVRLFQRGKDPTQFVSALATFAARAMRAGRRLCGHEDAQDVLAPRAQHQHNFLVFNLPGSQPSSTGPLAEALCDNTQTPPDEQAIFRIDFPEWLASLGERKRSVAEDLMVGERTLDVAHRYGLTPGRISQIRREFREDWQHFCGSDEESANE